MIQRGGTEVGRNPLHAFDADLGQSDQRLQPIDPVREALLLEQRNETRQLELDGGECLTELVVQLASEHFPLFLASHLQARGKLPQLRFSLVKAFLGDNGRTSPISSPAVDGRDHSALVCPFVSLRDAAQL
jgi:hypothetical protein